jgi:predicted NAD/FAD-binding protein
VRSGKSGLEYQGSSLNGLFAQRRNIFRPSFQRMLLDVLRFNRSARELLREEDDSLEMGAYLARGRYSKEFIDNYLVPMGAAIWSARPDRFLQFPARFLIGFFDNHGLLSVRDHPRWQTVLGGAARYVEVLTKPYAGKIRLNCPVVSITRYEDRVMVRPQNGGLSPAPRIV